MRRFVRALSGFFLLTLSLTPAGSYRPWFTNVAGELGLQDPFPNGGDRAKRWIVETTGSGIAWVDYDNDGLLDLYVISGEGGTSRLYRNEGHNRFRDVTAATGVATSGWAQGVCAGDYDNDGFTDLFVTFWGQNRLFHNEHGQRFRDVTAEAGLLQSRARYNTGCAFVDIDGDGRLDLFVANYLQFDPTTTPRPGDNPYCYYRNLPVVCGPRGLPFDRNLLYRNLGAGRFADISEPSGIAAPLGHYGLSVLTGDFNGDGLPDIYVACDQTPSLLYINQGQNRFAEEGELRGVAFDQNGRSLSGMGVAASDYAGEGRLSIFRTNFSDELESLYHNRGGGEFDDVTLAAGLGRNTRYVGWGTGFLDFDNDGLPDLLLVNGHVFPEVDRLHTDIHFRDHAILYRNTGHQKFVDVSGAAGPAFAELHSARGAAFGDPDNDGVIAIAVNNQNEPPAVWKQQQRPPGHWLTLRLIGVRSNRNAIGAQVQLTAGGRIQVGEVRSGGSYLSQDDFRLHFGLGTVNVAETLRIRWPGSCAQELQHVAGDRIVTVQERCPGA